MASFKKDKLAEICQKFETSTRNSLRKHSNNMETTKKREYYNLASSEPSAKSSKLNEKTKNSSLEREAFRKGSERGN